MTVLVPKSLTQPVPASQARSQIQERLDANREQVERLSARGKRQLVRQLLALEGELRERLDRLQREGRGDNWTAQDTEATLLQVRELLGRQGKAFRELLAANGARARALGVKNTIDVLRHFEGKTGGPIRPLAIGAAVAAQDPLLGRYEASVARWGQRTIGRVAAQLQRGLLAGETFDRMKRRLTDERRGGVLVQSAGDAARIVRTEAMHAYNAGAHEEMLAQRARRFPDLQKKLVETFDARTAEDSRAAHGEVRDLEGMFVDGKGRHYLHPPGRPNDRGVEIPWRREWESNKGLEPIDPIAPVERPPATPTLGASFSAPLPQELPILLGRSEERALSSPNSPSGGNGPRGGNRPLVITPLSTPDLNNLSPVPGKHCRKVVSALDPVDTERVLSIVGEAGLLPLLEREPLGVIEIVKGTRITPHPLNPKQPIAAEDGEYLGGSVFVNAGKRASGGPFFGPLGQAFTPGPPGSPVPDDFSRTAPSRIEAGRRTLIHEIGHHIYTLGNNGNRLDPDGPVARIALAAFKDSARNSLTDYARRNEHEYFCECFALYVFDKQSLQTHDPVGFAMIEDVLRLPRIALLPPSP